MLIDVNGFYVTSSLTELAARVAALEAGVAALDAAQPFAVSADTPFFFTLTPTPSHITSYTKYWTLIFEPYSG